MSLVAYGSSGEESEEEPPIKQDQLSTDVAKHSSNNMMKKTRESVKITIPSLKEFEDEEENDVPKKKMKFQPKSGSGLFSLLPPPKNDTTLDKPGFKPYVLSKHKQKSPSSATKITPTVKKSNIRSKPASEMPDQDSDDDIMQEKISSGQSCASNTDFFSLDTMNKTVLTHSYDSTGSSIGTHIQSLPANSFSVSSSLDLSPSSTSTGLDSPSLTNIENSSYQQQYQDVSGTDSIQTSIDYQSEFSEEPNPTDALLKDKEFLKLQGRRHEFEGIDIIDVNAADQLLDKNEWHMKSLTEETTHRPSRKKHNMPTSQQKRKHQITYLAFQAKEREMDLKNQWAMNSRTRRETQAKYGF